MALDREDNETKALAPISKITMVTAIDFYAGKLHLIHLQKYTERTLSDLCCIILLFYSLSRRLHLLGGWTRQNNIQNQERSNRQTNVSEK